MAAGRASLANVLVTLADLVKGALPGKRPERVVVELSGAFPAFREPSGFPARFMRLRQRRASLEDMSALVDAALRAPWLRTVVFRFSELTPNLTTALALRREFARLRAGGKRVEVVATTFDNATYFLASAADAVSAPPSAEFQVNGLAMTTTFLGGALARAGVRVEKVAIKEYKNAGDQLALAHMSAAQREQYGAYLDSVVKTVEEGVAERRGTDEGSVRGWFDAGVTSARQAQELGMIDQVKYEDEVLDEDVKPFAAARRYVTGRRRGHHPERVAMISLEGTIVTGASHSSPVPLPIVGGRSAGSETLVRALRAAGRDPSTKAVVLHVESGGGSALASDLIGREVELLAKRMPVVAAMGNVAGSGGYYVLTHATRVLAEATTLTGSIGVVALKPVLQQLFERYDVNVESVERGRFATMMASHKPFSPEEHELITRYVAEVYDRFVARVAEGRRLTPERVDEIGRGRIWSGADALGLGLVDELGGLPLALARAKELAGLPQDAEHWRVKAPRKLLLPNAEDPTTWLMALGASGREKAWLLQPAQFELR